MAGDHKQTLDGEPDQGPMPEKAAQGASDRVHMVPGLSTSVGDTVGQANRGTGHFRSVGTMAALAKRMTSWTTNGLLTAIVLVAGLGFGRQVLIWWSSGSRGGAEAVAPVGTEDGFGDPSRVHILQFADQCWSIRRQAIVGRQGDAAKALQTLCREVIADCHPSGGQSSEAERRLLAALSRQQPAEEKPGQWQLYLWNEGFPMVAGVRAGPQSERSGAGSQLAEPGRRVVTWGLAIPSGPESWTVLAFQPDVGSNSSSEGFLEIPLPPQCRKVVSVRVAGGGSVMAFAGPEVPKTSMRFYDHWLTQQGWKMLDAWRPSGAGWHVRYVSAGRTPVVSVDIHLGVDRQGQTAGVVAVGRD